MRGNRSWVLWGSELSPFASKVEALLRFGEVPFRWLPASGPFTDAVRYEWRRRRLMAGRLPLTWPRFTLLDEFPQVPFLFGPDGENLYDSSAIGAWLAEHAPVARVGLPDLRAVDAAERRRLGASPRRRRDPLQRSGVRRGAGAL